MNKSMHCGKWIIVAALILTGCSKAEKSTTVTKGDVQTAPRVTAPPQVVEQIAYTYSFDFKLPTARIVAVQAQHVALCDRLGVRCRLVSMDQANDTRNSGASMEIAVDANVARPFGNMLVSAVEHEGGVATGRSIEGENLSKQIVDVEAKLQGRQALANRLLDIVKTHQGGIADLIAAEKALADVQQEIDTAKAELAAARGRVAMSTFKISYAASPSLGGLSAPIADASANFGSIVGTSFAALLVILAAVLPWLVPTGLIIFGVRWWKRRRNNSEQ